MVNGLVEAIEVHMVRMVVGQVQGCVWTGFRLW